MTKNTLSASIAALFAIAASACYSGGPQGTVISLAPGGPTGPATGFASGSSPGFDDGGFATGSAFGVSPGLLPAFGPTVVAAVAPPPISGGTLLVLADGVTAIVSDPDRDAVYVVDTATATVTATVALQAGDEPGALSRWQYRGRRGTR